jgi:hypothetical protein
MKILKPFDCHPISYYTALFFIIVTAHSRFKNVSHTPHRQSHAHEPSRNEQRAFRLASNGWCQQESVNTSVEQRWLQCYPQTQGNDVAPKLDYQRIVLLEIQPNKLY